VFVDEPVVIDAPIHEDCIWEFQTKENRVLLFTLVDGNLKEAQEFFKVSEIFDLYNCILNNQNTQIKLVYRSTMDSTANHRFSL
jgi:hypothetical protein